MLTAPPEPTVPEPRVTPFSLRSTVPVGASGPEPVTDVVKTTVWPKAAGLGVATRLPIVGAATRTVWPPESVPELELKLLLLP